ALTGQRQEVRRRGVADPEWLQSFHHRVTDGLVPDRTYLVELAPETAQARRDEEPTAGDRMEAETLDFYHRVAAAYDTLAEENPERFLRLDGRRSIEALHEEIRTDVEALLSEASGTPFADTGSSDP
ncbi:MAG: dTMP kinase, partial [Salinibacter sp.]